MTTEIDVIVINIVSLSAIVTRSPRSNTNFIVFKFHSEPT
jgi:hypothetical protein